MTRHEYPRNGDKVVAVGLLTRRDLDLLGSGFQRAFPVAADASFDDLLEALERIEGVVPPPVDPDQGGRG